MIDKFGYNMSLKNKTMMFIATWNLSHQIKVPCVREDCTREICTIFKVHVPFLRPQRSQSCQNS